MNLRYGSGLLFLLISVLLGIVPASFAAGQYFEVKYPASTSGKTNELQLGVTYTLWIPAGVKTVRGVIVHQHGCGSGACKGGETAAYDLHWQALANKWNCALLGPSYQQDDKQNCRLWCDPRNGSSETFLRALGDFATQSKHPELESAPWCLWGHSGGGFWASLMQMQYPERIVAIWFRSGTAFSYWEKGEIPKPEIPEAAMQIPMMCNPGAKEKDDARFNGAWTGTLAMFEAYRAKGAPIGFAPDPQTSHECGGSRYLAIPFFDACLGLRLPKKTGEPLKPVNHNIAWLAAPQSTEAQPASRYKGDPATAVWLPNGNAATAWMEYVKTGVSADSTAPPMPKNVRLTLTPEATLTWDVDADLDSGIQAFVIHRDGEVIGQLPDKPAGRYGRPLFQGLSYHDTPERPLPEMKFVDATATDGEKHEYTVTTINGAGSRSRAAKASLVSARQPARER